MDFAWHQTRCRPQSHIRHSFTVKPLLTCIYLFVISHLIVILLRMYVIAGPITWKQLRSGLQMGSTPGKLWIPNSGDCRLSLSYPDHTFIWFKRLKKIRTTFCFTRRMFCRWTCNFTVDIQKKLGTVITSTVLSAFKSPKLMSNAYIIKIAYQRTRCIPIYWVYEVWVNRI